ncbi:hypothetical protein EC973_008157 [Apophysomyces ossiformis]|uniref:Uncharacterized protein n=1 Tax=Apophysomyces ossiformis TaxID=679940 RepID=A0A8H7EPA6_9FUNG|nr:hypothetical protein EC973_008157 [Apophysomyces ossiformis]
MSSVQTHTGESIRKVAAERRVVYKNVLDSPFFLKWPAVPNELGQSILSKLIKSLEPIGDHRRASRTRHKVDPCDMTSSLPDIAKRVHTGLNSVTRYLERQVELKNTEKTTTLDKNVAVFVCKREIKPVHLCSHLLSLAALANIKIVTLPQESEANLSYALGLNRVSAVLMELTDSEESLRLILRDVSAVNAPWLTSPIGQPRPYEMTNIKTLQTSVPIVTKRVAETKLEKESKKVKR